jgi:hypothetical protein
VGASGDEAMAALVLNLGKAAVWRKATRVDFAARVEILLENIRKIRVFVK